MERVRAASRGPDGDLHNIVYLLDYFSMYYARCHEVARNVIAACIV